MTVEEYDYIINEANKKIQWADKSAELWQRIKEQVEKWRDERE